MNIRTVQKIIIYDLSSIIFTGAKSNLQCKWKYNDIPTGGLYKFFTALTKDLKECNNNDTAIIFCFDSKLSESKRRTIAPFYKSNRIEKKLDYENYDITNIEDLKHHFEDVELKPSQIKEFATQESAILQLNIAKNIIVDLQLPYLYQQGIEADDLIYSLCYSFPNKDILIRADDSDLIDCKLFNSNTKFHAQTSKKINTEPTGVLLRKVISGDVSDNIKGIKTIDGYNKIVEAINKNLINPFLLKRANSISELPIKDIQALGFSEEDSLRILQTIYCVYPFVYNLDNGDYFEKFEITPDIEKLKNFLSAFGMKRVIKQFGCEIFTNSNIEQFVKTIQADIPLLLRYFLND